MKRNVEIPLKGISTLRELLFQEHHFPDAYKFIRLEAVEIDAAANLYTVVIVPIPNCLKITGLFLLVNQRSNFLTQQIIYH